MKRQRRWRGIAACAGALGIAATGGCGSPAKNVLADAAALEGQGKLEEAAAKLETGCALSPLEEPCPGSDKKASETWQKAAEKAMSEGRYRDAERLYQRATLTADEAGRAAIKELVGKPDMVQGLLYERALGTGDKAATGAVMERVAKEPAKAADKAKEWLAKERPAQLVATVTAACGPAHEGSCTEAWEVLAASGAKGPEVDKAQAAAEAEARRVYPLRVQAESFLPLFVERFKKSQEYEKCMSGAGVPDDPSSVQISAQGCFGNVYTAADPMEKLDAERTQEALFRRTLKQIGDSAIAADLEGRRQAAENAGTYTKRDLPKPKAAPKK